MKNIMDVLEQVTEFIIGREQNETLLDKKKKTAIVINLVVCANMHINFIFRFSFLVDHEIGTGQTLTATWKDK